MKLLTTRSLIRHVAAIIDTITDNTVVATLDTEAVVTRELV